jgi:hypothetical protein
MRSVVSFPTFPIEAAVNPAHSGDNARAFAEPKFTTSPKIENCDVSEKLAVDVSLKIGVAESLSVDPLSAGLSL